MSDYCYNLTQDNDGYIWIATEAGICTFDGSKFKRKDFPSLARKEIVELSRDHQGRIWLNELSGKIFYIEDGILKEFEYDKEVTGNRRVDLFVDHSGAIWICEGSSYGAIAIDGADLSVKHELRTLDEVYNYLSKEGYFHNIKNTILNDEKVLFEINNEKILEEQLMILKYLRARQNYNLENDIFRIGDKIFTKNNTTNKIRNVLSHCEEHVRNRHLKITLNKNGNMWLATPRKCLLVTNPLSEVKGDSKIIESFFGACVFIDKENNAWVSTLKNGIKMLSASKVKTTLDTTTQAITAIKNHFGYLTYLTYEGDIVVLDENKKEFFRHKAELPYDSGYDIDVWDDSSLIITSLKQVRILELKDMSLRNALGTSYYKATSVFNKTLWINSGSRNFYVSDLDSIVEKIPPLKRAYCNLPISESEAYIGTIDGLYFTNAEEEETKRILAEEIPEYIKCMVKGPDNTIWIGTYGAGIYVIQDDTLKAHINNLQSGYINDIKPNANRMWVATTAGLHKIIINGENHFHQTLTEGDGLLDNEIYKIDIHKDSIYVAIGNSISAFNFKTKFNKDIPVLNVENVKINERDTVVMSVYDLEVDQRNIKINFGGILYTNQNFIEYKYKMQGFDNDWIKTNQNLAQYPNMSPGDYTFMVKAKGLNSAWTDIEKISFSIPMKFVESVFSKILLLALITLAMILGFNYFYKLKENNEQLKLLQMTALRSQMNPHFIFNSLNSIQDYILRDDKRLANKYISRFSKLIRYILNASENEFTSLDQEIEALHLYLSLESMRFDNSINYEINVDPEIATNRCKIPTMLLQPYVENAIKHGLMHSTKEKNLTINIDKISEGLYFEITDNGIGRVSSRKINLNKQNNYDSKGNSINQRRIDLLNKSYLTENKVIFKDIYDSENRPKGTKVEILLQSIKFS